MNRNQLERLNKVLKSVVEKSDRNPKIEELTDKIESYREQLNTADPEEIETINYWINFYNKEIEEERQNPSTVEFESERVVKYKLVQKLYKEYKDNSASYKESDRKWRYYYGLYIEYGSKWDKETADFEADRKSKLEQQFKTDAENVVKAMGKKEFEEYYLIHSGKKAYQDKMDKLKEVKEVQSKLNDIINDYAVKFAMLTIEDFKTYVSLWNEFINEPCDVSFDSLYKVKYLGKLYEVYKYEVKDSVLYERVQCCTVDGVKKDLSNIYLKEIEIVNSESVKPFDVITYKGATYEVYKINVVGSELYKRVKAKSTISNKTRDFKNYYLKLVN